MIFWLIGSEIQLGKRSRDKGKRGEREWAAFLTEHGFDARRGQQYNGCEGQDVICECLPTLHHEVKRTERLKLYDALLQAKDDAGDKIPIVAHRRNRHRWAVILDAEDFLNILRESELIE